jgi:hypothetical protein
MGVDFELTSAIQVYDNAYVAQMNEGKLSKEEVRRLAEQNWGVVRELKFELTVVK